LMVGHGITTGVYVTPASVVTSIVWSRMSVSASESAQDTTNGTLVSGTWPVGTWPVGGVVVTGGSWSTGMLLHRRNSWLPSRVEPLAPPNAAIPHVDAIAGAQLRPCDSGTVQRQPSTAGLNASTRRRSRSPSHPPITYIVPSGPVTAEVSSCGEGIGGSSRQPAARLSGSSENASRRA